MTAHADNYAVVGHPVAHSLSPEIHAAFAEQTGHTSVRYGRMDVEPDEFAARCREFFDGGGKGLNVTAPHKAAAFALCDEVSDAARVADAVNTLSITDSGRLRGDNTDGPGLVRDLCNNLALDLAEARILLLGAGGAARGVAMPLLNLGPASLTIANRTRQNAVDMARQFAPHGRVRGCGLDELEDGGYDLIVNATAASLEGRPPRIGDAIVRDAVCYDMTYAAGGTPFTSWAAGCAARSVHTGIGMLVEQAALSFEIWRGISPETEPVLKWLADEHGLEF